MADTKTPAGVAATEGWLQDAPGGDINFDELFPPEGQPTAPTTEPAAAPSQPAAPQAPTAPVAEPEKTFLRTATGTVYKTEEDAVKGTEHKDQLINKLRQTVIEKTGIDPLTDQPVPKPTAPQAPVSYLDTRRQYFADLVEAVKANDPDKYFAAQTKLIQEVQAATLAPLTPLIAGVARNQAFESVSDEIKDVRTFVGSDAYKQTLETLPLLKEAVVMAETDPRFYNKLSELYRTVYWAHQGRNLPKVVQTQAQAAPAQPSQPVRPTTTSIQLAPTPTVATEPSFRTSEGRKEIMRRLEEKGVADLPM